MNSSLMSAVLSGATAAVAAVLVAATGSSPCVTIALFAVGAAIVAAVALATQSSRLQDEQRLVYRPVYVRRQDVQRRVTSDDR